MADPTPSDAAKDAAARAAVIAGEPLLDDVSKQGLTVAGTRAWLNTQLRSARRS